MNLIELYNENGHVTDKWGKGNHPYLPIYEDLFSKFKDRENNILEIGVYRGDSLNLWAEYFTNSKIYGIDPDTWQIDIELNPNVRVFKEDAYCLETLKIIRKLGKFQVIIDDGSHMKENQRFVIDHYFDLLTDDGVMIIEDVTYHISKGIGMHQLVNSFPDRSKVVEMDLRSTGNVNSYLIVCSKS
jgi:hypothetical protein